MGSNKNGASGAANSNTVNGVSPAYVPRAVYFLLGSALGVMAVLHASWLAEVGGEWASAARWAAQPAGSIGAHRLLVAISLLFLAASVWRLAKRCAAVEGRVGSTDSVVQALHVGGVVCAVCGSTIRALQRGHRVVYLRRRLKKERQLKKFALNELGKERRAAKSAVDIAMAKIACLNSEKELVEREARRSHEILVLSLGLGEDGVGCTCTVSGH